MKKILLLMLVLISSNTLWAANQTPPPEISYEIYEEYVLVTAIGEGDVFVWLYINGELSENPSYIARGEEDDYIVATATAQIPGEEISEVSYLEIFIPALEGVPMLDERWIVLLDRNDNEIWYPLYLGEYGDYTTTIAPYCHIFGCTYWSGGYFCDYTPIDTSIPSRDYYGNTVYDARFYYVIDGIRYGPAENYQEIEAGYALSNPLFESENYYTMKTGYPAVVGIACDYSTGELYAYLAYATWPFSDENNFPTPSIDYKIGDVDGDGDVNIADLSELIDILLRGDSTYNPGADVDQDGEVNISDVSELIDLLLTSN